MTFAEAAAGAGRGVWEGARAGAAATRRTDSGPDDSGS
jgi:hypothetical protein